LGKPNASVNLGKRIRMARLIDPQTGMCLICALDHGMTSPIFLDGLFDTRSRAREAISGGANVLMLSRGMAEQVIGEFRPDTSLALMLSASAAGRPGGSLVTPIGSVHEAARVGADAVVCYVALAGENENEMISYVSSIAESCEGLGMPFIAEAEFPDAYQGLRDQKKSFGVDYLIRNARLCAELGADIVKVNWSGDKESFRNVVRAASVPVVVAGGVLVGEEELLTRFAEAVEAGAIGCSVGRNVFQHRNPEAMMRAIRKVMVDRVPPARVLEELQKAPTTRTANRPPVN
jgi:DhnA family fructose-bisphosphate aldolase class Ia